jgi:hypothetical protein
MFARLVQAGPDYEREVSMLSSRHLLIVCFAVFLSSPTFAAPIGRVHPDGKVTEIIQVESGSDFRCRISGKSLIAGAPLRVHIRGIDSLPDTKSAKVFLETTFKQAKKIRLTNVRLRNYFRVIADVQIDQDNLADKLIKKGLARKITIPAINPDALKGKATPPTIPIPGIGKISIKKSPLAYSPKTIRFNLKNSLNDIPIDLRGNAFHPDMTFEDAIDQIRYSVKPALPIVVLWPEIERNSFVRRDTPIGIEWNGKISVKKGLDILLRSVAQKGGHKLQYNVDGGIITVASTKTKLSKPVLKVYDISELASSPFMDRIQGRYGNNRNNRNRRNGNPRSNRSTRNNRNRSNSFKGR